MTKQKRLDLVEEQVSKLIIDKNVQSDLIVIVDQPSSQCLFMIHDFIINLYPVPFEASNFNIRSYCKIVACRHQISQCS